MPPKPSVTLETVQAGTAFLSAFPNYVRVDISCKHVSDETPHELVELLQEQLKDLSKSLAVSKDSLEATQWPSLYVVSAADGLTSKEAHQDRGCLLLGLNNAYAETDLGLELKDWQKRLRMQPLFKDYYPPPVLEVHLIS